MAVDPPSSSRQSVPMALEATTRTAGGLRTVTSARGLLATHVARCHRPGRRLLGLRGRQPQQHVRAMLGVDEKMVSPRLVYG